MYVKKRDWHEGDLPVADSSDKIGNAGMGPLSDAIYSLLQRLNPDWEQRLRTFKINGLDDGRPPT